MSNVKERIAQAKQVDLRDVIELADRRLYGNYVAGRCPFHDDSKNDPSFLVYPDHFVCLSTNCEVTGDIFTWYHWRLYQLTDRPRGQTFFAILDAILGQTLPVLTGNDVVPSPEDDDIDLVALARVYHHALMKAPDRLTYFFSRGLRLQTVQEQWLGWDGRHYVLPVWEGRPGASDVVSLRLRRAAVQAGPRYSGIKGHNEQVLYNRYALAAAIDDEVDTVVVFYGEFDALLAWQDGFYAVSPTNGALAVLAKWFDGYSGNVIYVPDLHEEHAAYSDAKVFGLRGWVGSIPKKIKDYTLFRQRGGQPDVFARWLTKEIGLTIGRRRPYVRA